MDNKMNNVFIEAKSGLTPTNTFKPLGRQISFMAGEVGISHGPTDDRNHMVLLLRSHGPRVAEEGQERNDRRECRKM